jgi:hemin uptake protein HemP
MTPRPMPPRAAPPAGSDEARPRRLHSHELLGSGKEVEIVHGSQCYRLRLTSLGKLILTK